MGRLIYVRKPSFGISSLAQQASATSTAATITQPAGIIAGDLLVLVDYAYTFSGTPTTVVPTDYTSIVNFTGVSMRCIVSYKIAVGTEASQSITGMDGSTDDSKVLVTYRADVPIVTATPSTWNSQGTTGNPTSQSVTASGGVAPLIVIGTYGSHEQAVDPRTFSTTKDGEVAEGTTLYQAWKIYLTAPADTSIDMDDEAPSGFVANALSSGYIAVSAS